MNQPIRLYMSMSLDGYIAGPDDRSGQELGAGGGRLFNWLDDRLAPGVNGQVYSELMATGAVMSGRRTFELAGRWGGDHHDGVPIHVLTHHTEDGDVPPGNTTFHTDVASWAAAARESARGRPVMVHGAAAAQALIAAASWTRWNSISCRCCSAPADPYSRTALCIRWNWNWSDDWTDTTSLIFDTAFDSDFPADVPHIRWVITQSRRAQVGGWIDRFCDATRT